MGRKSNADAIRELESVIATLRERLENTRGEVKYLQEAHDKLANALADRQPTIAVLERELEGLTKKLDESDRRRWESRLAILAAVVALIAAFAPLLAPGCLQKVLPTAGPAAGEPPMIITRAEHLDAVVGQLITIQGEVEISKIPTILGVDVASDHPDLRGQEAKATGILSKWTVTQEQLDREFAKHGVFANRGPGTFYRLVEVGSEQTAQVRPIHPATGAK